MFQDEQKEWSRHNAGDLVEQQSISGRILIPVTEVYLVWLGEYEDKYVESVWICRSDMDVYLNKNGIVPELVEMKLVNSPEVGKAVSNGFRYKESICETGKSCVWEEGYFLRKQFGVHVEGLRATNGGWKANCFVMGIATTEKEAERICKKKLSQIEPRVTQHDGFSLTTYHEREDNGNCFSIY